MAAIPVVASTAISDCQRPVVYNRLGAKGALIPLIFIQLRFDQPEKPEQFEPLEQDCRNSVSGIPGEDGDPEGEAPLIRLVYDGAPRNPALAIVFARAAIACNPNCSWLTLCCWTETTADPCRKASSWSIAWRLGSCIVIILAG